MKIIIAAFASIAILSTSAAAQTDQKGSGSIVGEGGGSDIFMDKRTPEERDPGAKGRSDGKVVCSGGGNGI